LNELKTTFANRGRHPAIVRQDRVYTYSNLEQNARRAAALLQRQGMQPGDRVLLATGAKLPLLFAHLGILFGGGITVPLNPKFTADEMRYFAENSEARLAIIGAEQMPLFESSPGLTLISDTSIAEAPDAPAMEPPMDVLDPCLMIYSSGTTGQP